MFSIPLSTLFKVVLVVLLLFIIFNLARALYQMVKAPSEGEVPRSMSHYLGRRVLLSACVVLLLIIALKSGVIVPNVRPY